MEEGSESRRYWCHICSREVETFTEVDTIKCSSCNGGFVEEYDSAMIDYHNHNHQHQHAGDSESDRALSLWAPILLRMMSNPRRRRRSRQIENDDDHNHVSEERYRRYHREGGESELDRELESMMGRGRRRRSSATMIQIIEGLRAELITQSENSNAETNREIDPERVILINPYSNNTIIVQGGSPFDSGGPQNQPIGSLGDYFVGPGLELLLQHLAENDPNRYGTPPAKKEAVDAMPDVKIHEDSVQCSVCLEDFEIGVEAKEMPCKHRFHGDCILPWLEIHSSCPVCRYQLPSDESKLEQNRAITVNANGVAGDDRQLSVALPWPFSNLLSSTQGTQITNPHLIMNTYAGVGSESESGSGAPESGGRRDDDDQ